MVVDDLTDAEVHKYAVATLPLMAEANRLNRTTGAMSGKLDCKLCGGRQTVNWYCVAFRKGFHTRGACSTPNCIRWIE